MSDSKILKLTLNKPAFEVMVTGEKLLEFRRPSKWILSRLEGKFYDRVEFVNGYGADKPRFEAIFDGWEYASSEKDYEYSNGLKVKVEPGAVIIRLKKISKP